MTGRTTRGGQETEQVSPPRLSKVPRVKLAVPSPFQPGLQLVLRGWPGVASPPPAPPQGGQECKEVAASTSVMSRVPLNKPLPVSGPRCPLHRGHGICWLFSVPSP